MTKYIIRRLLQTVFLLFFISFILFILLQTSGDPIAAMGGRQPPRSEDRARLRQAMGLNQPVLVQYVYWLIGNDWADIDVDGDGEKEPASERLPREVRRGVMRGDFGTSIVTRQPALELIEERLPYTLLLMGTAQVTIMISSLAIGVYAALHPYSATDNVLSILAFVFFSMPVFWIAIMLMYTFAVRLDWFPTVGTFDPQKGKTVVQVAWHMVLPVTTITLISVAADSRFIRSAMLDVVNSDYVRTARAKGLAESRIRYVHALKNASLPWVTLLGLEMPGLLAGAVVTERIFGWPGMGRLYLDHLGRSDFPVMMGLLMLFSIAVIFFQLLTDIAYTWLDPRIRYN